MSVQQAAILNVIVLGVHNPVPRVIHQDYSIKAGGILIITNTFRSEVAVEGQEKKNKIWDKLFEIEVPGMNSIKAVDEALRYMRTKISAFKANKPVAEHPKPLANLEIDFLRQPEDGGKMKYFAIFRTGENRVKEEKYELPVATEAEFDLHLEHIKWTTGVAYRKRLAATEGQLNAVFAMEAPVLVVKEAAPVVENPAPANAPAEQGEQQVAAAQEQPAQQEAVVA